jgi:predicted transcriptional regulator
MRFPLLLTSDDFKLSTEDLEVGKIPDLRAIRLHNGTTYTWNRLCYGHSKDKPHLRIECRYLPSGPSIIDEIANFAFWVGLMNADPPEGKEFWKHSDFSVAKNNFIKASRTGLNTVFNWFGKTMTAQALITHELLPLAKKGLEKMKILEKDIDRYLGVIKDRVTSEVTGTGWIVENFRTLSKHHGKSNALNDIVYEMHRNQLINKPVHEWVFLNPELQEPGSAPIRVEEVMSTDIFSISADDSIDFAKSLLEWNNIHHLPVENNNGDLVGLITDGMIQRLKTNNGHVAGEIMLREVIAIQAHDTIKTALELMRKQSLSGLPVIYKSKLVGMITMNDLKHCEFA